MQRGGGENGKDISAFPLSLSKFVFLRPYYTPIHLKKLQIGKNLDARFSPRAETSEHGASKQLVHRCFIIPTQCFRSQVRLADITFQQTLAFQVPSDTGGDGVRELAVVYLACAPKSNAVYIAWKQALGDACSQPDYDVPPHLRNAPTSLMKDLGYGVEYRYAHDEPEAYAAGENYLPPEMAHTRYYQPSNRGLEGKIRDKLEHLAELDAKSSQKRYPK